jgi:hypothetical protein
VGTVEHRYNRHDTSGGRDSQDRIGGKWGRDRRLFAHTGSFCGRGEFRSVPYCTVPVVSVQAWLGCATKVCFADAMRQCTVYRNRRTVSSAQPRAHPLNAHGRADSGGLRWIRALVEACSTDGSPKVWRPDSSRELPDVQQENRSSGPLDPSP